MKTKNKAVAYSSVSLHLLLFVAAAVLVGCSNYGGGGNTTQAVSVAISPKTASVKTGQTQQFTASVLYATNTSVTWQVNGTTGGDATHGTISTSGLYTPPAAPPNPATVTVSAISQADSTKSDTASVTVTDGTPPTAPANLAANATSASQISLAWTASTDNVGVTLYQVQRCAGVGCAPSAQVGTSTTAAFTDTGLTASTPYSYRVSATDAAANVSAFSNTATATTAAAVSVAISPKTISVKTGQTQQLTASVLPATNTAVTWQVNGTTGGDATHGTISPTGLYTPPAAPPNPATVTVSAVSQADATKSDTASVTVTDGTPPTAPANLTATANSTSQISLAWTASTDNVGVTLYQVQRCAGSGCTPSTQVGTSTTAAFTDTGLTASTSYSYRVSASDAAANVSAFSNTASATTAAPAVSVTISPKTAGVKTGQTQQFTASVLPATNTAVTWQVNGTTGGDAAHGTISTSGLYTPPAAPPNPATVTVSAVSQADSTKSDTASVTITDGTPPTAPANLTATANSASQISLAWTASTDNVGVTLYQVQRCAGVGCSPSTQVGTSTTPAFTDTGLVALTPYSYRVSAADAAANVSAFSNTATATTTASAIAVALTPARGGVPVSQSFSLTSTVTADPTNRGVTWSFTSTGSTTGGVFSSPSTLSGTQVTFTAPTGPGVVTITATSVADPTKTAMATIGVTDLAGVYTYHNDLSRTGANTQEYALTTANVNTTTFGKLFSCSADAAIYAQPLWAANVSIGGVAHNVIYVATEHDTLYAFDADANASPCVPLWTASLIDAAHGGATGETWVSSADESGCGDLQPDIGIVGTPVIDATTNTLYVVSKSKNTAVTPFHQRIHAIDMTTGAEKVSPPVEISASVPGTGVGSSSGMVSFDPLVNNQRPALLLSGSGATSHVIVGWSSHCDFGAYHGWLMSYSGGTLAQEAVLNFSPNGIDSAVWMSGSGPAMDAAGNIYLATGNGTFDANSTTAPNNDYADSVIKLGQPSSGTFPILSYFRTNTIVSPNPNDFDQGSGGVLLLPTLGGNNRLLQAGKQGNIFVLDQASLGGFNATSNQVAQELDNALVDGLWGSPTYWNGFATFGQSFGGPFMQYTVDATGTLSTPFQSRALGFSFPGPTASVSALGATSGTGIVWALDNQAYCTNASNSCGPTVLHAYDATNLATEFWNSTQAAGDKAGNAVKFTVPTVANGKVYVGTRGNDCATFSTCTTPPTIPGELDVYGLKPN